MNGVNMNAPGLNHFLSSPLYDTIGIQSKHTCISYTVHIIHIHTRALIHYHALSRMFGKWNIFAYVQFITACIVDEWMWGIRWSMSWRYKEWETFTTISQEEWQKSKNKNNDNNSNQKSNEKQATTTITKIALWKPNDKYVLYAACERTFVSVRRFIIVMFFV